MADTLEQLTDELRADIDWEVRRDAARKLAAFTDPRAVEALVNALDDPDDEVQQVAVKGLAHIGDPTAAPALLRPRVYRSENPVTRWFAVAALGTLGEPAVVEALVDALVDEEWIVRNEAAEALKRLVEQIAREETTATARRLLRLLIVENAEVRELVIVTLCRMRSVATIPLVEAIELRSPALRAGICEVLGRIGNPGVAPAVVDVIDDESPLVREQAIRCLGRLGDPGTIDPIVDRLADRDGRVVAAAVAALTAFGRSATPFLINRLRHSRSRQMRTNIIAVLGKGKDPAAVLPLINCLSDSYFRVRRASADALVEHGEAALGAVAELLSLPKVPVDPVVRSASGDPNKRMRLRAIRSLGELKNPKTVETLRELTNDSDEAIARTAEEALLKIEGATWARYYATYVLGRVRNPRGVKLLLAVLGDPSPIVRYGAVRALGRISSPNVGGPLSLVLVSDADEAVRAEAAKALAQIELEDPVYVSMLLTGLKDPSPLVRVPVTRLLGRLENPRVVRPIVDVLEDRHWKVRRNAENALISMSASAVPKLVEQLAEATETRLLLIIGVLGEIGDPRAVQPLEALRTNRELRVEVRTSAALALGAIAAAQTKAR